MPYPHGPDCRCPKYTVDDGLLRYTVDCDHYEQLAAMLSKIAGQPDRATLRVLDLTPPKLVPLPNESQPCDQSMCCPCQRCTAERIARVRNGIRHPRQPWDAARKAA